MIVTLILPAGVIPDMQIVRKPTGSKQYTLRTDFKLYGEGAQVVKTEGAGIRFLVADTGVNVIPVSQSLAVDMEVGDAIEFLGRVWTAHEEESSQ